MNKNRIRLTESQLYRVIKESVNRVLNEQNEEQIKKLVNDTVKKLRSLQMLAKLQKGSEKFFQICSRGDALINNLMNTLKEYGYELEVKDDYEWTPTNGDNFQMICPSIYGYDDDKIICCAINNLIPYEKAFNMVQSDLEREQNMADERKQKFQDDVRTKKSIWGDERVDDNGYLKGGKYAQSMELPKLVGHIDLSKFPKRR